MIMHLQADLVLAKYTCIALNRVSGSVKKVKGKSNLLSLRPQVLMWISRLSR